MEIMLIIVNVKYLAKNVTIANVLFQIQHPLLENEILIEPPSTHNQIYGQLFCNASCNVCITHQEDCRVLV